MIKERVYDRIGETLYTQVLNNGLSIYTIPKPGFSKSYAFFATNYGGADRRFKLRGKWLDTPAGIAHFLEHKMFDTEKGNALMELAANGASPNAFTSNEITAYYFQCTKGFYQNLKTLLEFVSVPYFTEDSVSKEQGIIGQEIRMIHDKPNSRIYYNFLKALYKNHPARDTIAGTEESIAQITAQTLYDCHKVFYNPSNMVLCVVGDVDAEKIGEIAEEILPKDAAEIPVKDYGEKEKPAPFMQRLEEKMEVSLPIFMAGTKVLGEYRGDDYLKCELAGDLASRYIAGPSSPLYSKLYTDGLITGNFGMGVDIGRSLTTVMFSGESREPDKVVDAIKNEIEAIIKSGLDSDRISNLKKMRTGSLIRGLNHFENICYAQSEAHFADTTELMQVEVLEKVSDCDIINFLKEHLNPQNFALSLITPS